MPRRGCRRRPPVAGEGETQLPTHLGAGCCMPCVQSSNGNVPSLVKCLLTMPEIQSGLSVRVPLHKSHDTSPSCSQLCCVIIPAPIRLPAHVCWQSERPAESLRAVTGLWDAGLLQSACADLHTTASRCFLKQPGLRRAPSRALSSPRQN